MTMPLLTDAGYERLARDMSGLDVVSAESAEWSATVLCPENREVPVNFECPHSCRPGACQGCPAVEGDAPA